MATYKTPGVYVEEISTMPPSVAEVETAIPAFIGFTEFTNTIEKNEPKRITSLLEYQLYFGGAEYETNITVDISDSDDIEIDLPITSKNVMFYALQLYFANGGGPLYVASVGNFENNTEGITASIYKDALDAIAKEDEPTLLVFPDAPFSLKPDQYYTLMSNAIAQCTKLGDRFAIVDVLQVNEAIGTKKVDTLNSIQTFRGTDTTPAVIAESDNVNLKYSAAYFPYLNTTLPYLYDDSSLTGVISSASSDLQQIATDLQTKYQTADQIATTAETAVTDAKTDDPTLPTLKQKATAARTKANQAKEKADAARLEADKEKRLNPKELNSYLLNKVKAKLSEIGVVLTPCAAIAGVYASVDNARGVWKAPANVALSNVKSTTVKITDDDQNDMNIDVVAGKSINAIRPFVGKGVMVWGARTLDGNDNEWRFVSVRRFFIMVEESVQKSTYWAVFEPNDKNTWVKVRAMIENYLMLKWKDGALAGAKPDDAYFVRVGLGETMTADDILNGLMTIEIGMAAVRPAEFIVLKFSHKMQTS